MTVKEHNQQDEEKYAAQIEKYSKMQKDIVKEADKGGS